MRDVLLDHGYAALVGFVAVVSFFFCLSPDSAGDFVAIWLLGYMLGLAGVLLDRVLTFFVRKSMP